MVGKRMREHAGRVGQQPAMSKEKEALAFFWPILAVQDIGSLFLPFLTLFWKRVPLLK